PCEAVDLGLSVKWANTNLGAAASEEYGDFYAWGEVEPYYSMSKGSRLWKKGKADGYSWTSYKWCMGSLETMTKYCTASDCGYNGFTDNKTVLDPEDDVAHVKLGGKWRMPTDDEWKELMDNCTWIWTTQNGIKGIRIIGSNGNKIFLPLAGFLYETGHDDAGSYGYYWSSSLDTRFNGRTEYYAWSVFTYDNHVQRGSSFRYCGFPVRPVTE
ncbi:MAG: TonB-dependent receptor, partial [Bacteroidales bacterium]|nr:TonB-dependent receptor [Bacteroidales bacterium]